MLNCLKTLKPMRGAVLKQFEGKDIDGDGLDHYVNITVDLKGKLSCISHDDRRNIAGLQKRHNMFSDGQ
jgi:hypothetical protein